MGYREEERGKKKWKQKEKRLIKRPRACRTGSQTAPVPVTVSCSPHQAPTPSTSHMFWNLSPERRGGEVAMMRPLSGSGRRLFSQLLVTSAQCEGEQLSQASGMCWRAEKS